MIFQKMLNCGRILEANQRFCFQEKPKDVVQKPQSSPMEVKDLPVWDNKFAAGKFMKQFKAKINSGYMNVEDKQGDLKFKYGFKLEKENIIVTTTNLDEQKEMGKAYLPHTNTISYAEFYRDSVPSTLARIVKKLKMRELDQTDPFADARKPVKRKLDDTDPFADR